MTGQTILHYQIIEKLGEGGMGVVYKAEDTKLKRDVAIKFLPRHIAASDEERERFKIEARAAAALNHRDIKSANIMVTDKGQIKIMDFGLAKMRGGAQVTKVGTTLGTAAYMSPEQARGEEADSRSDIWAFGVVLYEMLTGKLPFGGDYEQAVIYSILNEEPKPLNEHLPDAPPELQDILNKTLEKEKKDRYQSAGDLLRDLQPSSDTTTIISGRPAARPGGKSKTGMLAAGAIGFVGLVALLVYLQRSGEPKPIRLTNPQKITHAISIENFPTWSPDGSKIAYTSNQTGQLTGASDIWMKQLSGGEPVNMTKTLKCYADGRVGHLMAVRLHLSPGRIIIAFW